MTIQGFFLVPHGLQCHRFEVKRNVAYMQKGRGVEVPTETLKR